MSYKQIGIVGGVGPSATVLYYQQIIEGYRDRIGGTHYPEILIHSLDLGEINEYFYANDLKSLSDKLVQTVKGLEKAGCGFALLACNTMHMVFDRVQQRVNVPMVSIVDAVLEEVKRHRVKRVGIMGTTFIMLSDIYRGPLERLRIECVQLDEDEQVWIMEAILGDLQHPNIPEETVSRLMRDVENLGTQGAEAVILACTDLPVAIREEHSPVLLLDTTKIHVKATLDFALGKNE